MRRNYPTCFEKISGRRWKQTWQWVAVLVCLAVALGCRRAGDATGRRGYNDGLAALAAGDLDKAQTAFVGALNHAAGDPDLQFRAKANLGIVSLRQGDKKRADKAPDPAGAMRDYEAGIGWLRSAVALAGSSQSAEAEAARRNLAMALAKRAALTDELRKNERALEARLDSLIDAQRKLVSQAQSLWHGVNAQGGQDPLFAQTEWVARANSERVLGADAGAVADLAADEIEAIGKKPEEQREPKEAARLYVLRNLDLHLLEARARLAEARRKFQELDGKAGISRAESALAALKRAREQFLDPVTLLRRVAEDENELAQIAQLWATQQAKQTQLGQKAATAPEVAMPDWWSATALAEKQAAVVARIGEARARFEGALQQAAQRRAAGGAAANGSAAAATASSAGAAAPGAGSGNAAPTNAGGAPGPQGQPAAPVTAGQLPIGPAPAPAPASGAGAGVATPSVTAAASGAAPANPGAASAAGTVPPSAVAPGVATPPEANATGISAEEAKLLAATARALPAVARAAAAAETARGLLADARFAQAVTQHRMVLEALYAAIEEFADVRGLIELSYADQSRVVALLGEAGKQVPAAERAQAVAAALTANQKRLIRLTTMLQDELATKLAAAAAAEKAAASQASATSAQGAAGASGAAANAGQAAPAAGSPAVPAAANGAAANGAAANGAAANGTVANGAAASGAAGTAHGPSPSAQATPAATITALYSRAEALRREALTAVNAATTDIAAGRDPQAQALVAQQKLDELRRLFFSIIEHLKDLIAQQGNTNEQTAATEALDESARSVAVPPLVQKQQAHWALADAIAAALAKEADALRAAPTHAGQDEGAAAQAAAQAKKLSEAQGLVAAGKDEMTKARDGLSKSVAQTGVSYDFTPIKSAQQTAVENLQKALAILQPPPQQNQNQQDQSQDGQSQQAQAGQGGNDAQKQNPQDGQAQANQGQKQDQGKDNKTPQGAGSGSQAAPQGPSSAGEQALRDDQERRRKRAASSNEPAVEKDW